MGSFIAIGKWFAMFLLVCSSMMLFTRMGLLQGPPVALVVVSAFFIASLVVWVVCDMSSFAHMVTTSVIITMEQGQKHGFKNLSRDVLESRSDATEQD